MLKEDGPPHPSLEPDHLLTENQLLQSQKFGDLSQFKQMYGWPGAQDSNASSKFEPSLPFGEASQSLFPSGARPKLSRQNATKDRDAAPKPVPKGLHSMSK